MMWVSIIISTSMVEYYSTSFRELYIIQGSLTGLRCRDEIVCPLIQHALQAMGPGAILCRTTVPLLTELRSSQIFCCPLSTFGSHQFWGNEQLKTTPPLLMCTSSPVSCSRCGRVNSSDPRPPQVSVAQNVFQIVVAIPAVDCHEHELHL